MRAVAALPAATGNLGKPGTGLLYLNGHGSRSDRRRLHRRAAARAGQPDDLRTWTSPAHLEDPSRSRAMLCWNMNPAASNPEQARLRAALAPRGSVHRRRSTCSRRTRPTSPTSCCRRRASSSTTTSSAPTSTSACRPRRRRPTRPAQALPNTEIFRRLAAALGLRRAGAARARPPVIDTVLERTGLGVSWEELCARGTVWVSDEPIVQFPDRRFPTPSGKVELASAPRPRPTGIPAPRCRSPTRGRRAGGCGCSPRPRRG